MAFQTFSITTPQYGASKKNKPRIKKMMFGDGYEQRSADGINTNLKEWDVIFKGDPVQINSVEAFFEARATNGLEPFYWVDPDGTTRTVVCEEWNKMFDNYGWSTISTTFREVPEKA